MASLPPLAHCAELLAALRSAGDRIVAVSRAADLHRPVPACPQWDLAALLGHLGTLWYFHGQHLTRGLTSPPDPATRPDPPDHDLPAWAGAGLEFIYAVLAALDPEAPAWNWGRQPLTAFFWQRRMAHEALVHRRDVEQALELPVTGYGPLAADAVSELLAVYLPRARYRQPWAGPTGTVLLHATDVDRRWSVGIGAGADLQLAAEGTPSPAAEVSGTSEQLVLAMWGRTELPVTAGDPALAAGLRVE